MYHLTLSLFIAMTQLQNFHEKYAALRFYSYFCKCLPYAFAVAAETKCRDAVRSRHYCRCAGLQSGRTNLNKQKTTITQ